VSRMELEIWDDTERISTAMIRSPSSIGGRFLHFRAQSGLPGPTRPDDPVVLARAPGPAPGLPNPSLTPVAPAGPPPLSWSQLASTKISKDLWAQAMACSMFDDIWSDRETTSVHRTSMVAGAMPGSARLMDALPMAEPFRFSAGTLACALKIFLGLDAVHGSHYHHCGNFSGSLDNHVNHLLNCSLGSRAKRPHDQAKSSLSHMIHQCGLSAALPRNECIITAGGREWVADILFTDGETTYALDVKVLSLSSDTVRDQRHVGSLEDLGSVHKMLAAKEISTRRTNRIYRPWCLASSNHQFIPFVVSSCGVPGPSARWFMNLCLSKARSCGRFSMALGQPKVDFTWNTLSASAYWLSRIAVDVLATNASCVNAIVALDDVTNCRVVGGQPHGNPNVEIRNFGPAGGTYNARVGRRGRGGG